MWWSSFNVDIHNTPSIDRIVQVFYTCLYTVSVQGKAGKQVSVELLVADIQQRFGYQTLRRAADLVPFRETLSTGIAAADELLEGGLLRGSAANSVVAYLLKIAPIDPIEHRLVFERFLSEERQMTPDIDMDFDAETREEVIQYLYEKYGRTHAAMACTFVT